MLGCVFATKAQNLFRCHQKTTLIHDLCNNIQPDAKQHGRSLFNGSPVKATIQQLTSPSSKSLNLLHQSRRPTRVALIIRTRITGHTIMQASDGPSAPLSILQSQCAQTALNAIVSDDISTQVYGPPTAASNFLMEAGVCQCPRCTAIYLAMFAVSGSACSSVLAIPELLENILSFLPARTIFRVKRVSQSWKSTIARSVSIQGKLFFRC